MKHLARVFLFNIVAFWLTTEFLPAIKVSGGVGIILAAGFLLGLLMVIVKPMLKILFIPFNFLTFGIAGLFINVVVIYLLTFILPEVQIVPYTFPGFSWEGFVVPSIDFHYIGSLLLVTAMVTGISHLLYSVSE
ncbi:MAG: phage holin family protein [Patescibacteria group bacterium]|nr:phage holin family protein [Patescibacteria group bacterium]